MITRSRFPPTSSCSWLPGTTHFRAGQDAGIAGGRPDVDVENARGPEVVIWEAGPGLPGHPCVCAPVRSWTTESGCRTLKFLNINLIHFKNNSKNYVDQTRHICVQNESMSLCDLIFLI